jgi:hypothetical protein
MVRLLQVFDHFELHQEDGPPGSIPPVAWQNQPGRAPVEKVWLGSSVVLFAKVAI